MDSDPIKDLEIFARVMTIAKTHKISTESNGTKKIRNACGLSSLQLLS